MEERGLNETEDLLTALYIQMSRVYDVLLAQVMLADKDLYDKIIEQHANGELLSPPPALRGTDEQE